MKPTSQPTKTAVKVSFYPPRPKAIAIAHTETLPDFPQGKRDSRTRKEMMMMTEVANHSKRDHTDSYFSGKAGMATSGSGSGSEEFGSMGSKKPRNSSPRSGAPISPKARRCFHI